MNTLTLTVAEFKWRRKDEVSVIKRAKGADVTDKPMLLDFWSTMSYRSQERETPPRGQLAGDLAGSLARALERQTQQPGGERERQGKGPSQSQ